MDIQQWSHFIQQYGVIAIFTIVLLEYLNLPGFPAGVILPLAGMWASQGGINFLFTLLVTVFAGLCGSWALYFLGRMGGHMFLEKFIRKFPKQEARINKTLAYIHEKGYWGVFIGKLIPVVRTFISIPAGVLKMNLVGYSLYSTLGITVWNLLFVGAGYMFGESVLKLLV